MSGHSKWSTIKRKKGANDAQRAKIFTKIAREIVVAVKSGGPDPDNNASLKNVIAKAHSNNMPNDNINRTIKKIPSIAPAVRISFKVWNVPGIIKMLAVVPSRKQKAEF